MNLTKKLLCLGFLLVLVLVPLLTASVLKYLALAAAALGARRAGGKT